MKKRLSIIICAMTIVLAITSCKDNKGTDYYITWGPTNIASSFEGTPEQVDSLHQMANQIIETVDNIYTVELMNIDTEKDIRTLIFRSTTAKDVKEIINEVTAKAEAQLEAINMPTSVDGLYFEMQVTLRDLTSDSEETIYTESFGDSGLLHQ